MAVTLPLAAANDGELRIISNEKSTELIVQTQGSDLFSDGSSQQTIQPDDAMMVQGYDSAGANDVWILLSRHPIPQISVVAMDNGGNDWNIPATWADVPGWGNLAVTGSDGIYRNIYDFNITNANNPSGNQTIGFSLRLQVNDNQGGGWVTAGQLDWTKGNKESFTGEEINYNLVGFAYYAEQGWSMRIQAQDFSPASDFDLDDGSTVEVSRISDGRSDTITIL